MHTFHAVFHIALTLSQMCCKGDFLQVFHSLFRPFYYTPARKMKLWCVFYALQALSGSLSAQLFFFSKSRISSGESFNFSRKSFFFSFKQSSWKIRLLRTWTITFLLIISLEKLSRWIRSSKNNSFYLNFQFLLFVIFYMGAWTSCVQYFQHCSLGCFSIMGDSCCLASCLIGTLSSKS